jgi:hypothetical protein
MNNLLFSVLLGKNVIIVLRFITPILKVYEFVIHFNTIYNDNK